MLGHPRNGKVVNLSGPPLSSWGSKPEPQKIPSPQIQPGQYLVQVDHLAAALERVVPIQQDVPLGRRRDIRVINATALVLPLAAHFVSMCDRMAEL